MNKNTFIFDFDGVILDTEKYHYLAWNKSINECVKYFITTEEYEGLKSMSRDKIIEHVQQKIDFIITAEQIDTIKKNKSAYYAEYENEITIDDFIPGVVDFITSIKQNKNNKLAVVSSSTKATYYLKKYSLFELFDVVIDGTYDLPKKPNPAVYLETVKLLKSDPINCVVFEDSIHGATASTTAGLTTIFVNENPNSLTPYHIKNFINFDINKL